MDWVPIGLTVLAIVALPFVVGPLLVRAALRYSTRPDIREVPETEKIPPVADLYLREAGSALRAAGFEAGPLLRIGGITPGAWMYAAMARRTDGDLAMAAAVFRESKGGAGVPGPMYVEFAADFADGSGVCTNNSGEAPTGPASDRLIVVRFPRVKDVARLLSLHREAVRRFGRGARKRPVTGDWWTPSLIDSLERYGAHMVETGWFVRRGDGTFVLTAKGAVLATWSNLPPWLWVRRWAAGSREREVARVMGV